MLHTKFCFKIGPGTGEEDFLKIFTIYGHGGRPGHVTIIMLTNFHFPVHESLHKKLVQNSQVVSENSQF